MNKEVAQLVANQPAYHITASTQRSRTTMTPPMIARVFPPPSEPLFVGRDMSVSIKNG
jgi:hypothetical protein